MCPSCHLARSPLGTRLRPSNSLSPDGSLNSQQAASSEVRSYFPAICPKWKQVSLRQPVNWPTPVQCKERDGLTPGPLMCGSKPITEIHGLTCLVQTGIEHPQLMCCPFMFPVVFNSFPGRITHCGVSLRSPSCCKRSSAMGLPVLEKRDITSIDSYLS